MKTAAIAITTGGANKWPFPAASIVPLYVGMATHEQADWLAQPVRSRLLTPGGILATEHETGDKWDKPNGWAPLQWMAIQGFKL